MPLEVDLTPVWSHADERLRPSAGRELREAALSEWRSACRDLATGSVAWSSRSALAASVSLTAWMRTALRLVRPSRIACGTC